MNILKVSLEVCLRRNYSEAKITLIVSSAGPPVLVPVPRVAGFSEVLFLTNTILGTRHVPIRFLFVFFPFMDALNVLVETTFGAEGLAATDGWAGILNCRNFPLFIFPNLNSRDFREDFLIYLFYHFCNRWKNKWFVLTTSKVKKAEYLNRRNPPFLIILTK